MLEGFFHAVKGRRRITRKCYTSFSFFSPKFCYAVRYFFPAFGQTVRVKKPVREGMKNMRCTCILCGQKHVAGLSIAGCFICFSCEQALLRPYAARRLTRVRRLRLLRLYERSGVLSETKC